MLRGEDLPFPWRDFLGVRVSVTGRADALEYLLSRRSGRRKTAVAFANTNLLNVAYRSGLQEYLSRQFVIFNDGVRLDVASRLCHGAPFPENLNGTDFTADLLSAVPEGARVFLFGAKPDVVLRAAEVLEQRYKVRISGTCDGYVSDAAASRLVERINEAGTDIDLVGLGKQSHGQWLIR